MQDIKSIDGQVREVDIIRIIRMLWKRAWVMVLVGAFFGMLMYFVSSVMINPTYRTKFTAYINNKQITEETHNTSTSDLSASKGLMYVYQEIVVSRAVLTQAATQCGLSNVSYGQLSAMVKAYVSDDAPILSVYVETGNPEMSKKLADAVAQVAPLQVSQVVAGSTMTLIDEPYTPTGPASPNIRRNTIYGVIMGIVCSLVILIVWDLVYDHVLDGDDLEGRYHIPVVGRIPDIHMAQKNDVKYGQYRERSGTR